jgi:hypothetical protein
MILPFSYQSLLKTIIGLIIVFIVFYPYIQAETLSIIQNSQFDKDKICKVSTNSDFRYIKIVNYERQKNTATLYCLYENTTKNSIVTLYNSNEGWLVEYTRNYKKDIGFYWPIYY